MRKGEQLHSHEIKLLEFLKSEKRKCTLEQIIEGTSLNKDALSWALESLANNSYVSVEKQAFPSITMTDEGLSYIKGFPEEKLIKAVKSNGGKLEAAKVTNPIGLNWAKKNGWISIDKGVVTLTQSGKKVSAVEVEYTLRVLLATLSSAKRSKLGQIVQTNKDNITVLQNRGIIEIKQTSQIDSIVITKKGLDAINTLSADRGKGSVDNVGASAEISQLTREMIKSRSWKTKRFRSYDISSSTEKTYPARLHPVHEFVDIITNIWISMGFSEVHGPIVESAFRNFDALFSPQDHPTRDMHDTFFMSNPTKIKLENNELVNRVKSMHESAWNDKWSIDLAEQAVLRTHATATTIRYIEKLASSKEQDYPVKVVSIGRVFRNESVDFKHLAELIQCDGIIIGKKLTMSNLIYTLKRFFKELNIEIIIKPSYFPFVEPGIEVHYYDQQRAQMIELCGAGIIRKQITTAMGTDLSGLAWGMGIDRQLLNKLDLDSLSVLYKNNIGWLRNRKEIRI